MRYRSKRVLGIDEPWRVVGREALDKRCRPLEFVLKCMQPNEETEMRRSGVGSGGGYGNRQVKHVTAPKAEPRARAKSPGGVGQIGAMQGNHITSTVNTNYPGEDLVRGAGYSTPVGPTSNMGQGPGANRTTMPCGGQGMHGAPAQGAEGLPSTKGQWPD